MEILKNLGKITFRLALVSCFLLSSLATAFGNKPAQDSVWVTQPDGALSCAPETAQTLEQGAEVLQKHKVKVLEFRKGGDGKMRIQVCGAPTGSSNAYLIPRENLEQAKALGYVPLDHL
ncbi:hypothetical protein WDW37_03865 [Bdellovibrionota bacterium FG-1]